MSKNLVVRYKHAGQTLEVLAKPNTMKPYREGKTTVDQVLAAEEIFSNASKFQKAKVSEFKKCCGTDSKEACFKIILDNGEFSLSKKEMNEMIDAKKAEIINYLHKYYHDPTKNPVIPHSISRLEIALNEMNIRIDPHLPLKNQLKPIVKKLPDILPVKPVNLPDDILGGGRRDNGNDDDGNSRDKRKNRR
jgi:rRNA metabolism SBDS family protein